MRRLAWAGVILAVFTAIVLQWFECRRRGAWLFAMRRSVLGRHAVAERTMGALASLRPECALAHEGLAEIAYRAERFDRSLAAAERLAALEPDGEAGPRIAGNALMHLGRYAEAAPHFARAARASAAPLHPDPAAARMMRNLEGFARYKAGDLEESLAIFEALCAEDPAFVWGWMNRALALERLGRREEADAAIARALALDPAHGAARYVAGALLCLRGDARGCAERVRAAIEGGYRAWRYVRGDPDIAAARALPEFAAYLDRAEAAARAAIDRPGAAP